MKGDLPAYGASVLEESLRLTIAEDWNWRRQPGFSWIALGNNASAYFFKHLQRHYADPKAYAKKRFEEVSRVAQNKLKSLKRTAEIRSIEEQLAEIKADINKIRGKKLQTKMLQHTSRISDSLVSVKTLEEHERKLKSMEDDLTGVRRLIGTKGFGEWKSLVFDVEYLKKRVEDVSDIRESYKEVLDHQTKVLDNQAKVLAQQSNFISWIKYSTILVPLAVAWVPIIETLIRHFLSS